MITYPISVHIHSRRKRLVDVDGVSAKAAIDGLVLAGFIEDDSPKFIKEVSYSQEKVSKGEAEETFIFLLEEEESDKGQELMRYYNGQECSS